jgi:hypothetical protein
MPYTKTPAYIRERIAAVGKYVWLAVAKEADDDMAAELAEQLAVGVIPYCTLKCWRALRAVLIRLATTARRNQSGTKVIRGVKGLARKAQSIEIEARVFTIAMSVVQWKIHELAGRYKTAKATRYSSMRRGISYRHPRKKVTFAKTPTIIKSYRTSAVRNKTRYTPGRATYGTPEQLARWKSRNWH